MSEKKHVTLKLDGVSKSFAKVEADEVTQAVLVHRSGRHRHRRHPAGCGHCCSPQQERSP